MGKHRQIKVLICPLNWGLGHASRVTQVIKYLLEAGAEVVIAADGPPAALLQSFFPEVNHIHFKSCNVKYSVGNSQIFKILFQFPCFMWRRFKDHERLKRIIGDNKIDLVISDNRPGLWNNEAYTVYVTHQVMVKLPGLLAVFERAVSFLHRNLEIRHYDECWIPDVPGMPNLSGDLSHKYKIPKNASFIGLLSRFASSSNSAEDSNNTAACNTDLLILLSGPEPQRTELEKILSHQVSRLPVQCTVIRGLPGESRMLSGFRNINSLNHTDDDTFRYLVAKSKYVICRAGYSTLMDLVALEKKAIIVPTPGQTEQEYLAGYLSGSGMFLPVKQDEINLAEQLVVLEKMNNRQVLDHLYFMPVEKIVQTIKKAALKAKKQNQG
ncbi:MAG TPA: glycosyltransferase [Bacteroidales bacterium]|nr:glycosyltransferase [Bacteroidales bacterium]